MEAAVVTSTATASAQGTPKADEKPVVEKKPEAPAAAPVAEKDAKAPASETPKTDAVAPKPEEVKPLVYDIKLPKEAKVSAQEVDAIKGYAKENGLSNEQAQGIASYTDSLHNKITALRDGPWLEECKNHATYGKENFPKSCENIKRFLERVAPKLQPILDQSGYANRVEVFEFLAEMASKGQDDNLVQGKQTVTPDTRTPLQKFEDDYNKKYGKKG